MCEIRKGQGKIRKHTGKFRKHTGKFRNFKMLDSDTNDNNVHFVQAAFLYEFLTTPPHCQHGLGHLATMYGRVQGVGFKI